jgi:hypothetical protein
MTPTIVTGVPLSAIDRPRTPGSPPNRRCHIPWLNTITAFCLGTSSSALNPRPSAGATRSNSNRSHDTDAMAIRSGPSVPLKVSVPLV